MAPHATSRRTIRISRLQRTVESRITNPLIRVLLRSPLHWLVSQWLVLVSYEGPKTGHRYTFPVLSDGTAHSAVVVTPKHESNWWRNFARPYHCSVWVRGRERAATGELLTGPERHRALDSYVERYGFVGRLFGIDPSSGETDVVHARATSLAVVRFSLDD